MANYCCRCETPVTDFAAVITKVINPSIGGAIQWQFLKTKYEVEKAKRVYCVDCIESLVDCFIEDEQIVVGKRGK